jgi:hypothetical protein
MLVLQRCDNGHHRFDKTRAWGTLRAKTALACATAHRGESPAPRHAGRLPRARACARRLSGQMEWCCGSEGWCWLPRRSLAGRVPGEGAGWTPCKICFKLPIRDCDLLVYAADAYTDAFVEAVRWISAPRWAHTEDAGIDGPFYDAMRDKGVALSTNPQSGRQCP